MRILFLFIIHVSLDTAAQIPRNNEGLFEYTQKITTGIPSVSQLKQKARKFFNQPFLVHWDSIAVMDDDNETIVIGKGYINVRAKHHGLSIGRQIPVSLQLAIAISDSCYTYTFNKFMVDNPRQQFHFPLEEKPEAVKSLTYDQMLRNTHERVSFVIGWLKGYMEEK